jgi:hypothetical protein
LVAVFPSRVAWKAFQKVHSGIFEFPSHKAQDFDEVIQRLKGQERIIVTHEQTGGRPKLVYMLATT